MTAYFAVRPGGLGFVRRTGDPGGRPYQHYSTLVGMRFGCGLSVDPKTGRHTLSALRCPAGARAHNRALTEMRWRATFSCPFAFAHPCHACPKGQTSCPAACRPLDLVDAARPTPPAQTTD
jgi:hypothetical protein